MIEVLDRTGEVDGEWEDLIKEVLGERDVSLAFVSKEEIRSLNKFFKGKDEPTDVLSFDLSLEETDSNLAQIVVCPSEAEDIRRVVVHGLVHLLGYDHQTEEEENEMRSIEKKYYAF